MSQRATLTSREELGKRTLGALALTSGVLSLAGTLLFAISSMTSSAASGSLLAPCTYFATSLVPDKLAALLTPFTAPNLESIDGRTLHSRTHTRTHCEIFLALLCRSQPTSGNSLVTRGITRPNDTENASNWHRAHDSRLDISKQTPTNASPANYQEFSPDFDNRPATHEQDERPSFANNYKWLTAWASVVSMSDVS